jgi:hypothetical protein
MDSPLEAPHKTTFDDLGVLINFFVFCNYQLPTRHISVPSILLKPIPRKSDFESRGVDHNVACEISHFSRFRKRFYDQVFELLDGCSGGVVVD